MVGRLAAAALALALAGCAAPVAPPGPGPSAPLEPLLALSLCDGFAATAQGPSPGYPDGSPAGWPPPEPWPTTASFILLLRCQRIAWGALERPATVLLEWRGDAEPPPACQEGAGNFLLASLWSDDEVLVAQAKALGMPALQGTFTHGADSVSGDATWTWGPPGQRPSSVKLAASAAGPSVRDSWALRLLWAEGSGLGSLDLRGTMERDERLAWGTLRAPMLHGVANPVPDFATVDAGARQAASAEGVLHRFGDTRCEQPL